MDVVKKTNKKSRWSSPQVKLVAGLVLLVLLFAWAKQSSSAVTIERSDILLSKVVQGDLDVVIAGYGTLTSNKQQLITSLSRATVKEIVLKPGAAVTAKSVIVRLENPELQQQLDNAQQQLVQNRANLRQLKLNNQRELLNESASLAQITANYETAALRRTAEEKLVKQGIVSQLTFAQSQLNERQLAKRIDILNQRTDQLILVQQEAVNISLEQIKQQQGQVKIAQSRLDKLQVTAGIDGVLQRLSVELGQSLDAGQEIALIGSVTDLIALIRVPQSQAQQVVVGQQAIIDTRRDKITGRVARIDPIVESNTVNIEIALPASLPASARPQLSVDGVIIAQTLKQVNYIKRPANAKANSQISLYKLDEGGQSAHLQTIQLGRQAGQFIEVMAGAALNDQFIISDASNLQDNLQDKASQLSIN